MKIAARIRNAGNANEVELSTNDRRQTIDIAARPDGRGLAVNGGELLFLALATCFCNDVYREAAKRNIAVDEVSVVVEGDFGAEGEPASNVVYRARVTSGATDDEVRDLLAHTDAVAEIHNTLRRGTHVTLQPHA